MEGILVVIAVLLLIACIWLFNERNKGVQRAEELQKTLAEAEKNLAVMAEKMKRYSGLSSLEDEITERREDLVKLKANLAELDLKYKNARAVFDELRKQIRLYESDIEMADFGVYAPIFELDSSDEYKALLTRVKDRQKQMIKDGQAAKCDKEWSVEGSRKKGETMIKRSVKLALRAFNGECNALIAKVKWNNAERMTERIEKAREQIDKANKSLEVYITSKYLQLKLEELKLTHEFEQKKQDEKEEARAIREEMREAERAEKEIAKAKTDAEKEEARYQKALEKAEATLKKAKAEEVAGLNEKIEELRKKLDEAHQKQERAKSRAQTTKSGHVYIISNIGSFGEDVVKIGMTRRLEPMDRVRELGDASVPFRFDVHGMVFSDDAPALENALHQRFSERRVNLVNKRKEYFYVSLDEVVEALKQDFGRRIHWVGHAEAKEYRESIAIRRERDKKEEEFSEKFPVSVL